MIVTNAYLALTATGVILAVLALFHSYYKSHHLNS